MTKVITKLVRYSMFGLACSTVTIAAGTPLVLPICLLCFSPLFLGNGR